MIELDPAGWDRALESVRTIPINTLFVQSIFSRHVDGRIFADHAREPSAFYGLHPYGMALLWGRPARMQWLAWLREHLLESERPAEWLQVYPDDWVPIVEKVLEERVAVASGASRWTRVNFAFDRTAYLRDREHVAQAIERATIVPTTATMFSRIDGSVVPKRFWRDPAQFVQMAGGFTAIVDGEPAATAFCSYRHGMQLEIGIETVMQHRGKGYARLVACALIDDCLRRGLEPVWACRLENVGSFQLACKLGFRPVLRLPYFRLPGW